MNKDVEKILNEAINENKMIDEEGALLILNEIKRLYKILYNLKDYMLDIDFKMGWQYVNYLEEKLLNKEDIKYLERFESR